VDRCQVVFLSGFLDNVQDIFSNADFVDGTPLLWKYFIESNANDGFPADPVVHHGTVFGYLCLCSAWN